MTGLTRPELLASTEWLAENLGRPELRILDVRWRPDGSGRRVHAAGHIPGAALPRLAGRADRACRGRTRRSSWPGPTAWPRAWRAPGSATARRSSSTTTRQSLFASRVWWSLRAYGFESARILDGGFPAWAPRAARCRTREHSAPPTTVHAARPARDTPDDGRRPRPARLARRAPCSTPARPAEYRGYEGNTKRLGHIPGAVNVPVGATNQPGTQQLRDGDELRDLLHKANVTRGRRMVCYDGSGVAAAKLAFVLTLLGHEDVAVYDGGWAEWGNRLDLPVDR